MMNNPATYRVVYVEPGKPACVKEIGTELHDIQEAVGGACLNAYTPMTTGLFWCATMKANS